MNRAGWLVAQLILLVTAASLLVGCTEAETESPRADGARRLAIDLQGSLQNPAWSPDSRSILITRFGEGYNQGPADLMVIEVASGDSWTLVSEGSDNINLPGSSWNPQTNLITFASTRDPHDEIFVIPADGRSGDEERITSRERMVAYEPSFSPEGEWVVFESHPLDEEGEAVIMRSRVDGTAPFEPLTDPGDDCRQPNWSPTGDLIICQCHDGEGWSLWLMGPDGADRRRLTDEPGDQTDASFSPDGKWVVFSGEVPESDAANLSMVPVLGGAPARVTRFDGYDGAPSWSPDGGRIAFESYPGDPDGSVGTRIWIIDLQ